jgi:hypothetical protein
MSSLPLWKPTTQTLRLLVPAMTENETLLPAGLIQLRKPWPPLAAAAASRRTDSEEPTPTVTVGGTLIVVGPDFAVPVQLAPLYSVCVMPAVAVPVRPVTATFTLPSVNCVVAVDPEAPVAVTVYCATNQSGSAKLSVMAPVPSAVTSTSRLQVLPASSLTRMWTDSPGCHCEPSRRTVSPGA